MDFGSLYGNGAYWGDDYLHREVALLRSRAAARSFGATYASLTSTGPTALFGSERQAYWRRRLADSGREEETAPVRDRLKELQGEISDLERRIELQVANLEAEDATPSLRRRVGARIAELEEAAEERRQHANALTAQSDDAPPTVAASWGGPNARASQPGDLHRLPRVPANGNAYIAWPGR